MALPTLDPKELKEAQLRVAMTDLNHFRDWLTASGRDFLTFKSADLPAALEHAPENLLLVQQLVSAYTQHRMGIVYDSRTEIEPTTGEPIQVPVAKDDRLTPAEKDRVVRQLVTELVDQIDGWSLDGEPL